MLFHATGQIRVEHYGKPSDRTHRIARMSPGEGPEQGDEGVARRWAKVPEIRGEGGGPETVPILREDALPYLGDPGAP